MLDRDPQERLDELAEDDLARHRLRGLDYRPDIQLLDGRANGGGGRCRDWCVAEMRMKLFELPNLAIGSPTQIAVAGVLQIHTGNLLKATRRVEAGSEFIGERLIVNKAVGAGRADGLFEEAHRVNIAAVDASYLGADQRGAVLEIVRAIFGPEPELPVVGGRCAEMLLPLVGRRGVAGCGVGQRAVKHIFGPFEVGWRGPQQSLRPRRSLDGRRIIAGKEARLQLADP